MKDFCHQCYGKGWVKIERQPVRCACQVRGGFDRFLSNAVSDSVNHPSTYPQSCHCGYVAESFAVWDWHQRVDHTEVVYSPYRDNTDHWSIDMHQDGEHIGTLAFTTEIGWREACKELGLGDPIAEAMFEAKQDPS